MKYTEHESFGLGWRAIQGCKCLRCVKAFKNPPMKDQLASMQRACTELSVGFELAQGVTEPELIRGTLQDAKVALLEMANAINVMLGDPRPLREDGSPHVRKWQRIIGVTESGSFDKTTSDATKEWQRKWNTEHPHDLIRTDGIVDEKVWARGNGA